MSNIYIQEPPTLGKVLLKTTVGDIDVELWSRECPKACRNFIQLCMENYYNGTIFHRVVKGFIVQGGDPNGDGTGGESVYGVPFKDEFHSRLRFIRRGLVGMANSDKDDNGSQFFFTMGPAPELTNKHTLFGKVTGDTVFNMLKLEDGMVDHNERPMYPNKILKTEILNNPFNDIEPRENMVRKEEKKKKSKDKGVKNFGLLSFGEEADQDEQETASFVQKLSGKGKSTHDVLNDPTLSKKSVQVVEDHENDQGELSDIEEFEDRDNLDSKERTERVKNRLNMLVTANKEKQHKKVNIEKQMIKDSDSDDDVLMPLEEEMKNKMKKKKQEIMDEILLLKKNYQKEKDQRKFLREKELENDSKRKKVDEIFREYNSEREKYSNLKEKLPKKGATRENFTLELLSKFKNKLQNHKNSSINSVPTKELSEDIIEKEIESDDWLGHTLKFEDNIPVLAKDASTKSDDWYDVYDPRNPLNKRKRGEDKRDTKKNKR
ncbi:spliceosome-associated protein CWC27 homolog [Condylostylus longicornis]|uniref:spliceosome-associated protein CWC27 homolog n=1 Tax=Condylostylus longicornis TaxID=2530218 RepID=UPI00244E0E3E|nr:spliceosome-associated protein CWC27 homolog [Condylostylus longicornis]